MASEALLQLLLAVHREAVEAKQAELMRLVMLVTAESLASGEIVPGDPEFTAMAARMEAQGLTVLRVAAESVTDSTRKAAEYAAAPGGEAVAEAIRRQAASAAALGKVAEEYAAFMRRVGALVPDVPSDSDSDSSETADEAAAPARPARSRRPNTRFFGPEWSN